jgi:hypothetical protein
MQVPGGYSEGVSNGFPIIDVQGAAIVKNRSQIVISSERVMPWELINRHRRLVFEERKHLQYHGLVAAPHPLCY